jgi:hypothetical protein
MKIYLTFVGFIETVPNRAEPCQQEWFCRPSTNNLGSSAKGRAKLTEQIFMNANPNYRVLMVVRVDLPC